MPTGLKRPPLTPIDPASTLAVGLVGAWSLAEGAGPYAFDASVAGRRGALAGSAAWASSPFGQAINVAATGDGVTLGSRILTGAACSVAVLLFSSAPTFNGWAFDTFLSGSGDGVRLGYDGGATGKYRFTKSSAFSSTTIDSDAAATASQWDLLIGVVNASGAMSMSVNGVQQAATGTRAGTMAGSLTAPFVVKGTTGKTGSIALSMAWDRPLTAAEQWTLARDPFALWRVPSRWIYGGGGAAFQTAWARRANTVIRAGRLTA